MEADEFLKKQRKDIKNVLLERDWILDIIKDLKVYVRVYVLKCRELSTSIENLIWLQPPNIAKM